MRKAVIVLYIPFFVVFFCLSLTILDPDFGWRLAHGQRILLHGLSATDPYSYSMPSYHFIDHEWLTHVWMFLIYKSVGIYGVSLIFSVVTLSVLYLITRGNNAPWRIIQIFLAGTLLLHHFAVKPQLLTWFFFGLLIFLTYNNRLWNKYRWVLPLLFIVWANSHGGFFYGLGIVGIKIAVESYERKRLLLYDVVVFLISVLVTLINPYGVGLWTEVLKSVTDPRLRLYVLEWMPAFYYISLGLFVIMALYLAFMFKFWKNLSLYKKVIAVVTMALGISSSRNIPLWVIAVSPLVSENIVYFESLIKKKDAKVRMRKFWYGCIVFVAGVFLFDMFFITKSDIESSERRNYPINAVAYLKRHPTQGNYFSFYEWGGYLIWKLPEKRVFIDGRMPSWKNPRAPAGESQDALDEFLSLTNNKTPFSSAKRKYGIDTVMLPAKIYVNPTKNNKKPVLELLASLKKLGMKLVYKDSITLIYR